MDDHDVYVAQLQEVFDSCDSGGQGRLTRPQLIQLCSMLQLDDQADALVNKLMGTDPNATVTFDQFKEGFVAVLSNSVDGLDATSEEEEPSTANDLSDEQSDISPKFVKGDKKYGRRSRPVGEASGVETPEYSDTDVSAASPAPGSGQKDSHRIKHQGDNDSGPIDPEELKLPLDDTPDTFEAEGDTRDHRTDELEPHTAQPHGQLVKPPKKGQLNQSHADMEKALDPVSEEAHLRDIWRELGVGTDGYLVLNELGTVCDHIGMDEMNAEELQHLFDKLDVDSDGRVSFHEFLHGLFQHGGPSTPSATPVRSQSTPRQKLRFSVAPSFEDRPQTPSFISTISGLFSTIDPDSTGYATAGSIVELWEKLGVTHGMEILEYLQFDTSTKVALADLSSALEQEMRTVEEDNATYQAAIVSYQHELKYLKTMSDTAVAERDKLKQDLAEANQRITLLIKEGDERQATSDEKREKELLSLETRYQEQIRALQSELDSEKEVLTAQSARQRTRLEGEVGRLKEDEARLRDKLSQTQRELEQLEHDILEMAEKCADLEKVNQKQQRELEDAEGIKLKLVELESAQAQIADEQSRWHNDRLQQLETERKDLKDKNDELTMQTEELRQQLASTRRRSRTSRSHDPVGTPNRTGSVLSDYQRPSLKRRNSDSLVSSEDEEGSLSGSGRIRRRLPQPPTSGEEETLRAEVDMLKRECTELKKEVEALKEQLKEKEEAGQEAEERLNRLNRNFNIERKDIEQSYKLEITDIEEQYEMEKERLLQQFEREKEVMREDVEAEIEERLAAQESALKQAAEEDKRDVLIRLESEKNLLKQQLNEERANMRQNLELEMAADTTAKLHAVEEKYTREIESLGNEKYTGSESLNKRVAELELELKLQREEMELDFEKERTTLLEESEQERSVLHQKYRTQIVELENSLAGGVDSLKGKLMEDFNIIIDQHRAKIINEESQRTQDDLLKLSNSVVQQQEEREKLLSENRRQMEQIEQSNKIALEAIEEERKSMMVAIEDRHSAALSSLQVSFERRMEETTCQHEQSLADQRKTHQREQVALEEQLARTCEELISAQTLVDTERAERQKLQAALQESNEQHKRHLSILEGEKEEAEKERHEAQQRADESVSREQLEEELESEIQARLEDEFLAQIARLKSVFTEERDALEKRIEMLQNEMEEQHEQLNNQTIFTTSTQDAKIEKLTQDNNLLYRQKQEAEERLEDVNQHYRRLLEEKDISRHQLEQRIKILEEHNRTVNTDILKPASVPTLSTARAAVNPVDSKRNDQVILDALAKQQELLETTKGELRSEIRGLATPKPTIMSSSQHRVGPSQEDLIKELELTTAKVVELETALSLAQSEHQREIRTLRTSLEGLVAPAEVSRLQEALATSQRKVQELEAMFEQRASETSKMIQASSESHQTALQKLEAERDELVRQLDTKKHLLNEQVDEQRKILEKNVRRDLLIKDLYVENANLMKSLYETERREKEVNSQAMKLQDRCSMLQLVVQKVTHAALA